MKTLPTPIWKVIIRSKRKEKKTKKNYIYSTINTERSISRRFTGIRVTHTQRISVCIVCTHTHTHTYSIRTELYVGSIKYRNGIYIPVFYFAIVMHDEMRLSMRTMTRLYAPAIYLTLTNCRIYHVARNNININVSVRDRERERERH